MSMNGHEDIKRPYIENPSFKQLKNLIVAEFGPTAADDDTINRFLIARENHVKKAYTMLKKDLHWREKNHVGTILEDYQAPEVAAKYFSWNLIGFDKRNLPVIVSSFGRADSKGFSKSITKEDHYRHYTFLFEQCRHAMKERSKEIGELIDKCIFIGDTEGLSLIECSSKTVIDRSVELCVINDEHYPESLHSMYIINASTVFQLFFSILKPFIASKTLQKIKIYGKEGWKEELLKIVDPEILPAYLGGKKTDPDGNPMCISTMSHGGSVPEHFYLKNQGKFRFRSEPGVKSQALGRRSKFDLSLKVNVEGSFIEWDFETDNYDIGFGLCYKGFDSSDDQDELMPLINLQRSSSCQSHETGSFKCEKLGIYILTFDNSYSFLRSKNIYYRVSVVTPEEKESNTSN